MMQKKRDDFKATVKRALKEGAGFVCSNPNCKVLTDGGRTSKGTTVSVGVASHICAAAEGGPRYDPTMTKEQRMSYDNGIWLCQTCSKIIDVDVDAYPVALLLGWKKEAEYRSKRQVGKKSIAQEEHDSDIKKSYAEGVVDTLNGSIGSNSIQAVIHSYERQLNDLDNRFDVSIKNSTASNVVHWVQPKRGIEAKIDLEIALKKPIGNGLKDFLEYGRPVELDCSSLVFKGSKLFEKISEESKLGAKVRFEKTQEISVGLFLRSSNRGDFSIDNFTATLVSGSKGFMVSGNALSGLFEINFISDETSSRLNMKYEVDSWQGKNILNLPNFSRIKKIKDFIVANPEAALVFTLSHDLGDVELSSKTSKLSSNFSEFNQWFVYTIQVIEHCIEIARDLNSPLLFKKFEVGEVDYQKILHYSSILTADPVKVDDGHKFMELSLSDRDDCEKIVGMVGGRAEDVVTFVENHEPTVFNILGNKVLPPKILHRLDRVALGSFSRLPRSESNELRCCVYATAGSMYEVALDRESGWKVLND